MSNRQDVFGLEQMYRLQITGDWSTKNDVWSSLPTGDYINFSTNQIYRNTGYFGGGYTAAAVSTVERIDYLNDTATATTKGPLSLARSSLAATGNSSYGWFGGGFTPATTYSTVDRVTYATDTATASPRGPLSVARSSLTATGNSSYGWFGGGFNPSPPQYKSRVDRIDYSNDTVTASPRGPLSLVKNNIAATGNSNFGYFGGGFSTVGTFSTVDRIDYSNDTATATTKGPLSLTRNGLAATGNSSYGWFGGGSDGIAISTVDRIDYSNDTVTASPKGPLSDGRFLLSATGNNFYGYFSGGKLGIFPVLLKVDRINYANDTVTTSARGPLTANRYSHAATSAGANGISTVNITLPPANNPIQERLPIFYGYFGGNTMYRVDYANDLATASTRGQLTVSGNGLAATGNSSYGYFGGLNFPVATTINRLDYANDTATAPPRGQLSFPRNYLAATGNSSYGWFGGGTLSSTLYSIVDRIDYSNDNATASPKGRLSADSRYLTATGNSSYGYFGGGMTTAFVGGEVSRVDRINYANDTVTASPKGPLSAIKYYLAATGNSSYGYFGGGRYPGAIATVDRINYANDTVTASPRGPLSVARSQLAATGNSSYGWFGGGYTSSFPNPFLSIVDRVDYSNDTATASVRGPLPTNVNLHTATSATANGLPQ